MFKFVINGSAKNVMQLLLFDSTPLQLLTVWRGSPHNAVH